MMNNYQLQTKARIVYCKITITVIFSKAPGNGYLAEANKTAD